MNIQMRFTVTCKGEIGHQHIYMQVPQAAAISPLATSPNP